MKTGTRYEKTNCKDCHKIKDCEDCKLVIDLSAIIHNYDLLVQELIGAKIDKGDRYEYFKSNPEYYSFVPSGYVRRNIMLLDKVKEYLRKTRRNSKDWKPKFLDCGCGIGNIMMLAAYVGYEISGIEYEEFLCRNARIFLQRVEPYNIMRGDILEFERYHDYDVIYYYVPIRNHKLMAKFAAKLLKDMKVGAVLIPLGWTNLEASPDSEFKEIPGINSAYIKIK